MAARAHWFPEGEPAASDAPAAAETPAER